MKVSVIIPTYNRKRSLIRCLNALPKDVEIIVVDDGGTDGTADIIHEVNHPDLILVRQSNSGPASARNAGISRATGEYLAFTDDDCVPQPPWPWPLVERLRDSSPDIAGIGGKVVPLGKGLISRYYAYHRILEPPESCSYIVTANCVYRADVLGKSGGFNANIRHAGGEDPGLSFAVRAMGYRLAYYNEAVVAHDFRSGVIDFCETFYRYGKGCAQIGLAENGSPIALHELVPSPITFTSIHDGVKWHWNRYAADNLRTSERIKFLPLVVLQRFSYNFGWRAGTKIVAT